MRILHVLDHSIPVASGYSYRTRAIIEQQRSMGYDTEQITSSKHPRCDAPQEEIDGLRFHRVNAVGGMTSRLPVIRQIDVIKSLRRRLHEVVAKSSPDVLHAHSPCLVGVATLGVGRRHGIPVVYELRALWEDAAVDHGTSAEGGLRYRASRALETYVLRRADAITTICEGLRQDISSRGIDEDEVTVVPNAVDIDRFSVDTPRDTALARSLGVDGPTVIGYIGSLINYEGLHLLVEAIPRLLARDSDLHFLVVGGGTAEQTLRNRVQELGLEDTVTFTGHVSPDQVPAYYSLLDICVYPRLSMKLTELVTPLKPLEAMASGKLVVASDIGGHREMITDNETGLLFEAGNVKSLAVRLRDAAGLLTSSGDAQMAARRYVETERSWPGIVSRYDSVYARLLREHHPHGIQNT